MEDKKVFSDHTPNFVTLPLADNYKIEKDSKNSIPTTDSVEELKDWVDFKEM